jgi:hypothetical protein
VTVSLINEAQLGHGPSKMGNTDLDPMGDKADHTLAILVATIDPTYQSSLESNSEGGGEVYMVGMERNSRIRRSRRSSGRPTRKSFAQPV